MSLIEQSLADPDTIRFPYGFYERVRREDPVHFDPKMGAWLVTRHADIMEAVQMPELSSELGLVNAHREPYQDEIDEMMRREGFGPHSSGDNFNIDPPRHRDRRALVNKAFSSQSVAKMEQHVSAIVRELADRFIDRGQADLVTEFTIPIAIYVIADILGFPRDRMDDYKRWSDASVAPLGRGLSKEEAYSYARDLMEAHHFLHAEIEARRAQPTDDLLSALVHARLDDQPDYALTEVELLSCAVALLTAGNETTRNGMSWNAYILARNPEIVAQLRDAEDQEKMLKRFVEESLRFQAPVPQLPRFAVSDCEIGGVAIPAGSFVYLCWASANRDETRFERPDAFDINRKDAGRHITFGAGIHNCVGQMLARMEMKCQTREIVNRMGDLKLVNESEEPEIWGTVVFRGPTALPVTFSKIGD